MTGEPKSGPEGSQAKPDLQAGGAAEGWASHAGHLEPEDFSQETPAAQPAADGPSPNETGGWTTLPPGTYPPTGAAGTMLPQAGRSNMLPWVVIGALLILVMILVGALNLRDYHLVQRGQFVEVRRGGWLPGTTRAMAPESSMLLRRYAPLKLEPGMQYRTHRYTEREDLDEGLIGLIVELIGPALTRADEDRVEHLGARLELFPTSAVVLEGRHKELLGKVGLVRGRRAEADALDAVLRARDLYRRYHRHAGPEVTRAIERLDTVQGLLSGARLKPVLAAPAAKTDKAGSEF
jgi:hypothetical protein